MEDRHRQPLDGDRAMSQAPERVKQSTEKRTVSFDFTNKLKTGDSVSGSPTPTITADVGITAGSPSLVGNVVSVQLSGGTNGTRYNVACNVTTTPGADILELDVVVRISDSEN